MGNSSYIIFADESGDHNLRVIDQNYPIFCLAFCVFDIDHYIDEVVPGMKKLKFKYWGHDNLILHERDIRKETGAFRILRNEETRKNFYDDLNEYIKNIKFKIFTTIIKKEELKDKYQKPFNPYKISLFYSMEEIFNYLFKNGQRRKTQPILFESRGKKEDQQLELEFRRVCDNEDKWGYRNVDFTQINFEFEIAKKLTNSQGLQIADLVARPIGLNIWKKNQENRAYQTLLDTGKIGGLKTTP